MRRRAAVMTAAMLNNPLSPAFGGGASLVVAPEGGLCNRMRVMLAAANAAAAAACRVRVAWRECAECGCRFGDVFAPLPEGFPEGAEGFLVAPARFRDTPASRRNLWLPALARKAARRACRSGYGGSGREDVLSLLSRRRRVYVSTCFDFFGGGIAMGDMFRPAPQVAEEAGRLAALFGARAVGVHIREGDNAVSRRRSPARLFAERLRAELSRDPQARFFLASDSEEVRRRFAAEFPGSVVASDGVLSRSSVEGMRAAAADLFALARTSRIIGSYWSSFSGTAAELGGIPVETLCE